MSCNVCILLTWSDYLESTCFLYVAIAGMHSQCLARTNSIKLFNDDQQSLRPKGAYFLSEGAEYKF